VGGRVSLELNGKPLFADIVAGKDRIRVIYGIHMTAVTRAKDGMLLTHDKVFYARTPAG
jgi:hypothetical protein